jgi:pilus assembly protein CpaE
MSRVARVLVADDDESIRGLLRSVLESLPEEFQVVALCENGREAIEEAHCTQPDVVLLDVRMPEINGLSACRQIREFLPQAVVVMISALGDEEFVREATAAGARDYIVKPFKIDRLLDTIRRELDLSRCREEALSVPTSQGERRARVWAFWSPRSGAGVTSLAINTALEVARVDQTTLFVDLDLVFSDSEQLLGLTEMYDMSDLVDDQGRFDVVSARTRIEIHSSGLHCLYQHDAKGAGFLTHRHVGQLIRGLGQDYDYVVLDLPADLSDMTGAALDAADAIWLVAGPDPLAARNITKALGLFHNLGYDRSKVHMLLNRVDRKSEARVRPLLPGEPLAVFPESTRHFLEAMKTAYPVLLSHPSSPYSRALKHLVAESLALTTIDGGELPTGTWTERFLSLIGRE